jgi:hypothetical protein
MPTTFTGAETVLKPITFGELLEPKAMLTPSQLRYSAWRNLGLALINECFAHGIFSLLREIESTTQKNAHSYLGFIVAGHVFRTDIGTREKSGFDLFTHAIDRGIAGWSLTARDGALHLEAPTGTLPFRSFRQDTTAALASMNVEAVGGAQ